MLGKGPSEKIHIQRGLQFKLSLPMLCYIVLTVTRAPIWGHPLGVKRVLFITHPIDHHLESLSSGFLVYMMICF